MYLGASGLSWSMQDLPCVMWALPLQRTDSLVVAEAPSYVGSVIAGGQAAHRSWLVCGPDSALGFHIWVSVSHPHGGGSWGLRSACYKESQVSLEINLWQASELVGLWLGCSLWLFLWESRWAAWWVEVRMALGREPGADRVGASGHWHHGRPQSSGYIQLKLHNSVRVLIRKLGSSHDSVLFFFSFWLGVFKI